MIASADRKADRFPIIVAEWQRNTKELVRVALDRFKGGFTLDIRVWWRDGKGVFRPARQGLTLGINHLSKLADAMSQAVRRAEALGLLDLNRIGKRRGGTR